jgi:branched-chain amino acid transport system substrate-binding protein
VRRATLLALAALTTVVGGCGADADEPTRVEGDTLTIYASLPAHGVDAPAGADAAFGMRQALSAAGGRAAGRRIRLVILPSTRPEDASWDPGTVEANAERAVDDPTTIAYLGELDRGGSAVSIPVTNRDDVLQISPADGLTSLTRRAPGRPRAGPERYYPAEQRTFMRLVPPDLDSGREIVRWLRERGSRRLVLLHGDEISDRELEATTVALIGEGEPREITRVAVRGDDPDDADGIVEEAVSAEPDSIVFFGANGLAATAVLSGLSKRLDGVPLRGGPPLVPSGELPDAPADACALTGVPQRSALPPKGRKLLEQLQRQSGGRPVGGEALLGYEAMRLALDAIEEGGPDRRRVMKAARAPREQDGVIGRYEITARGDVVGRPPICVGL